MSARQRLTRIQIMWLISTRLNLSGQLRVHVQKAVKVDHQNHDFLMVKWLLNSKKVYIFFSAGEQEMIMNAYEEYKTIIMAKSNTATAVRARQEAVYEAVYAVISMYEYLTASVSWYRGFLYWFESALFLVQLPSPPSSMWFYISLAVALN